MPTYPNKARRTIAIGDIHGCSRALAALIEAVQPGSQDEIVPLGDYIDNGPDSRGVIDQLIALAGRCRLIPLRGSLIKTGAAGVNSFTFNGLIGGHRLAPGSYRLTAVPTANRLVGNTQSIRFQIAR